jgi:phosphoribosylaminoimidazolecarboxamide formyltransferase/IMP cyclohydrolase
MKEKIALISVYNKEGIVEFGKQIIDLGFKILASGGTAKVLSDAGIEATDVATLVGGGPILGHRVVTLSREIHAGLLARDTEEDRKELSDLKIPFIDLVCVDLYPLSEEIAKWEGTLTRPAGTLSQRERGEMVNAVLEKTDIGGPTMLRSAAKGRRIVICDPKDRTKVVEWLKGGEENKEEFINTLCAKVEYVIAEYCLTSARFHSAQKYDGLIGEKVLENKYGENAWQVPAGLYVNRTADKSARYDDPLSLANFKLVAGASPSYNNLADVDRLLQTITHIAAGFDTNFGKVPRIAVGVKHGNPCGAAVAEYPTDAIKKMLEGDLRAIFGGVVMLNFEVDEDLAEVLLTHKMPEGQRRLLDGIIAPSFTAAAIDMLKRKGDKCRFLVNKDLGAVNKTSLDQGTRFRYVRGGFLKQPNYNFILDFAAPDIEVTGTMNSEKQKDLLLAWAIGSTSNSNTVTLVKDSMLIGNGVGQQDRVSCCELAIKRSKDAGHKVEHAAAYSDSFFPFTDGPKTLVEAGIKTIFATSGSVRDEEVKKFCQDNGVNLVMAPDSEARGFFGH